VHEELGVLAHEEPRGSRVVEVDVREDEVPEVPDLEPLGREAGAQRVQAARGPTVDERRLALREEVGADDALATEVPEVGEVHAGTVPVYSTVSVPSMPPSRWPGTAQ
jgi:hypothetical protein